MKQLYQLKQRKINDILQTTINKVSKTLRSINEQITSSNILARKDFESINLIFNLDILIKAIEDLEEQLLFAKSNMLNKNILSLTEKHYIQNYLENQQLNIKYEDEIYKLVRSVVSLQNNHAIIIVKIPILDQKNYNLLQLEPVN